MFAEFQFPLDYTTCKWQIDEKAGHNAQQKQKNKTGKKKAMPRRMWQGRGKAGEAVDAYRD